MALHPMIRRFETLDVRTGEVKSGRTLVDGPMSRWGRLDETDGLV